jgi:hypothetical protein
MLLVALFQPCSALLSSAFYTNILFLEYRNEDFPDEDEPPGSGRGMLLFSAQPCTTHMGGTLHGPDMPRSLYSHMIAGASEQSLRHGPHLSAYWSESKVHGMNIQATLGFFAALMTIPGQCQRQAPQRQGPRIRHEGRGNDARDHKQ